MTPNERNDMPRNDGWREFDRNAARASPRILVIVVAIVVVLLLIGALMFALAPWKGANEARQQTEGSGRYRIAAYDKFYDDCAAIQAIEDQIKNLEADKTIPPSMNGVSALRNRRATLIRAYNADSRKADTLANFKASDLPYEIDPDNESETSCTA